jgi:hypothetical protein
VEEVAVVSTNVVAVLPHEEDAKVAQEAAQAVCCYSF